MEINLRSLGKLQSIASWLLSSPRRIGSELYGPYPRSCHLWAQSYSSPHPLLLPLSVILFHNTRRRCCMWLNPAEGAYSSNRRILCLLGIQWTRRCCELTSSMVALSRLQWSCHSTVEWWGHSQFFHQQIHGVFCCWWLDIHTVW